MSIELIIRNPCNMMQSYTIMIGIDAPKDIWIVNNHGKEVGVNFDEFYELIDKAFRESMK